MAENEKTAFDDAVRILKQVDTDIKKTADYAVFRKAEAYVYVGQRIEIAKALADIGTKQVEAKAKLKGML